MLKYISPKGYHYAQKKNGTVVRIGGDELNRIKIHRIPRVGDKIKIIVKPYHLKKYVTGIVKRVLTKSKYHSRGHKVMLMDGIVGRTVEIYTGGKWKRL